MAVGKDSLGGTNDRKGSQTSPKSTTGGGKKAEIPFLKTPGFGKGGQMAPGTKLGKPMTKGAKAY